MVEGRVIFRGRQGLSLDGELEPLPIQFIDTVT